MRQERVTFAGEDAMLEGVLALPEGVAVSVPGVVVCHPHPQMGGDMYNLVVEVLCGALREKGIATLRFNFRGAGGSTGEHGGGVAEREDVFAALDYLRTCTGVDQARVGLAGYSFGAAVALNCAPAAGIKALLAVSAPLQMLDFTAQTGLDFPVLLLVGDRDQYVPADRLRQTALALGPATRLEVVPGADHFWSRGTPALKAAAGAFFALHLLGGQPELSGSGARD